MEAIPHENQKKLSHQLKERIKELECLYDISVIAAKPNVVLDQIIQNITNPNNTFVLN